ncbi:MAG: winged helix-turn-helix transcriptional regulator [Hyphomicrobiaceae bacterium]|nr:winged helix-turn-helix transcriptional regulator [Hyphomicrobiaceae bacterium]MCC0025105.1 winged helix-turn-helix transcriptional regulator [Hyphomicrobiaceae bacterium]
MKEGPDIARAAALIGDPARANILTALMAGKALTASELASEAGVTLQTASSHLSKLAAGGLLTERKQGRHKYFALASEDVAKVLEGLMNLAAGSGHLRTRTGPRDIAMKKARVCYNHLAGEMGTRLYGRFSDSGYLVHRDGELHLTAKGREAMHDFGIDIETLSRARAPLCRDCLDWSERTSHLAGSLGRAILTHIEDLGWARRDSSTRAVLFSKDGERAFNRFLARG